MTEEIKNKAMESGSDLVGIVSIDRFNGAPKQMDPIYIFPEAKVIIVFAFRIPRGYFRGIEEGTYFNAYPSMGYGLINLVSAPVVLREVACLLEDKGYEAVPYPNIRSIIGSGKPVSPDKPFPDVLIDFRIAAFCAGLGEIGYSKIFLTPEFGPRQRFALMLTDAPLELDPIYEGVKLCDRCMLCVKDCSGNAISRTETVKVKVGGRELEWGKLDNNRCIIANSGGVKETSPFFTPEFNMEEEIKKSENECYENRKKEY